jgi:diguanylate cyclase (GGDEF)-like protein
MLDFLELDNIDLTRLLEDADKEMNRVAGYYRLSFPSPVQQRGHLLHNLILHIQPTQSKLPTPPPACAFSLTAAHQSLDPNHFIPLVLEALSKELGIRRVALWRTMNHHRGLGLLACHPKDADPKLPHDIPGNDLTPEVVSALRDQEPRYLLPETDLSLLAQLQCQQALVAPVLAQGRLFGLLWLDQGDSLWSADQHLADELERVSHELGIALTNSATLAREKKRAELDGLTGLHNRASLDRLLERAFSDYQANGPGMVLGLVDVDKFKIFNDRFGHQSGDDVLKVVAQSLSALLRPEDILGRYGGDEFLFALIGANPSGAEAYAERVRQEVERRGQLLTQRFEGHAITISQGLAATGNSIHSLADLIAAADEALYQVKRGNRNGVLIAAEPAE